MRSERPRITVVGLGLIGGSLARRWAPEHPVTGWDPDPDTRTQASRAGLAVAADLTAAVQGAEVVVLAVPLAALPGTVAEVAARLAASAVLTDVGSVKGPVYDAAQQAGLAGRFVGGHPMAGTEFTGFAAADPTLFEGSAWAVALEADTSTSTWLRVAALCLAAGARVVPVTAAEHDAAVARISHLPHLLAAALSTVAAAGGPLALALAAGSFRDGTRVAATPPALATAMCGQNAAPVAAATADVVRALGGDPAALLAAGHAVRSRWPAAVADRDPLDPRSPDLRARLLALGRDGGWVSGVAPDRLAVQGPA